MDWIAASVELNVGSGSVVRGSAAIAAVASLRFFFNSLSSLDIFNSCSKEKDERWVFSFSIGTKWSRYFKSLLTTTLDVLVMEKTPFQHKDISWSLCSRRYRENTNYRFLSFVLPLTLCCIFGLLKCKSTSKQSFIFHPCCFFHITVKKFKETYTSPINDIVIYLQNTCRIRYD